MKKYIMKSFLAVVLVAGASVSCSGDDDSSSVNNNNNSSVNSIINTAMEGTWEITSFIDSGNNETNHFTDYTFKFGSGGVLTAVNTSTYTGTWSVTNSNSSNDDSPSTSDIDFNINFAASSPADFLDLNDDWDIASVTADKISLVDVSGGNGGTDVLVFEKIN